MRFEVSFQGKLAPNDDDIADADSLQLFLDRVMEKLLKLRAENVSISATGSTGAVEISVTVDAASVDEAVSLGSAQIGSAVHAVGGFTAEWDSATARKDELVGA